MNRTSSSIPMDNGETRRTPNSGCTAILFSGGGGLGFGCLVFCRFSFFSDFEGEKYYREGERTYNFKKRLNVICEPDR